MSTGPGRPLDKTDLKRLLDPLVKATQDQAKAMSQLVTVFQTMNDTLIVMRKACGDQNINVCVAEGCYGEACTQKKESLDDPE